jgi:hypothetical protein
MSNIHFFCVERRNKGFSHKHIKKEKKKLIVDFRLEALMIPVVISPCIHLLVRLRKNQHALQEYLTL